MAKNVSRQMEISHFYENNFDRGVTKLEFPGQIRNCSDHFQNQLLKDVFWVGVAVVVDAKAASTLLPIAIAIVNEIVRLAAAPELFVTIEARMRFLSSAFASLRTILSCLSKVQTAIRSNKYYQLSSTGARIPPSIPCTAGWNVQWKHVLHRNGAATLSGLDFPHSTGQAQQLLTQSGDGIWNNWFNELKHFAYEVHDFKRFSANSTTLDQNINPALYATIVARKEVTEAHNRTQSHAAARHPTKRRYYFIPHRLHQRYKEMMFVTPNSIYGPVTLWDLTLTLSHIEGLGLNTRWNRSFTARTGVMKRTEIEE